MSIVYLDNAATTGPCRDVLSRAADEYLQNYFNPSALYGGGVFVRGELNRHREALLRLIASPAAFDAVFTSCGTEADNFAVFCCARRGNAVTTAGEHAAVYQSFQQLKERGVEPRYAALHGDGSVDVDDLLSGVDEKTSFVSVVHVNNETGAVNPIDEIARLVKQKNPRCVFHSDGVQAFGKIPVRLTKDIDLYSVSAHKIGGLKGVGALFKRKGFSLSAFLHGGGQESNLRSGTENMLGISAFRYAAEAKFSALQADASRLLGYRELLWELLDKRLFMRISPEGGTPYILTVSAKGLRGAVIQQMLSAKGVYVGTGSACSSKKPFSRVIEACGYREDVLYGVLRISFSPKTTEEEVHFAATEINRAAAEFEKRTN